MLPPAPCMRRLRPSPTPLRTSVAVIYRARPARGHVRVEFGPGACSLRSRLGCVGGYRRARKHGFERPQTLLALPTKWRTPQRRAPRAPPRAPRSGRTTRRTRALRAPPRCDAPAPLPPHTHTYTPAPSFPTRAAPPPHLHRSPALTPNPRHLPTPHFLHALTSHRSARAPTLWTPRPARQPRLVHSCTLRPSPCRWRGPSWASACTRW